MNYIILYLKRYKQVTKYEMKEKKKFLRKKEHPLVKTKNLIIIYFHSRRGGRVVECAGLLNP